MARTPLAFIGPWLASALAIGLVACFLAPQLPSEYKPAPEPSEDEVVEP